MKDIKHDDGNKNKYQFNSNFDNQEIIYISEKMKATYRDKDGKQYDAEKLVSDNNAMRELLNEIYNTPSVEMDDVFWKIENLFKQMGGAE